VAVVALPDVSMVEELRCNVCSAVNAADRVETTEVRSDIRKFVTENFRVWRCGTCKSIHSRDQVDLAHYYAGYPFHNPELDWRLRAVCKNMLGRLTRAGFAPEHHLLDYGCGGGTLIKYFAERGYSNAVGYDEYEEAFKNPAVLDRKYDFVVSQDVIEHVLEPWDLLHTFDRITRPGGVIAIGTPNAENIDLQRPDYFVHALHQPFHTHILSRTVLIESGEKLGWKLVTYYDKEFINTLVPFVNLRFAQHYTKCFDDTMDAAFDMRVDSWKLWTPLTPFYAFFGYFLSEKTGGMAIFQKPA
jgi:2-polyprenyl-3-methyl-5-hydroxy-6-metoxy-1,4-benzoquinol methylase